MKKSLLHNFIFGMMLVSAVLPAYGQADRYTEEEIVLQNRFIEATREKLLGHNEKAIELFRSILKDDRDNHAVAFELARLYHEEENFTNALNYCERAISNDPENIWYWKLKANILEDNQQFDAAAQTHKRLSGLIPEDSEHIYEWAENLKKSGDLEATLQAYNEIEEAVGVQERSSKAKFEIYRENGQTELAIYELEKLSEAFPRNVRFMNNLAGFLQQKGKEKEALNIYQKILTIDPNHPEANLILAGNLNDPDNESAYLLSIQELFENQNIPLESKIKEILPYLDKYITSKDTSLGKALLHSTHLIQNTHPEDARSYALYADVLIHADRIEAAIRKYQKTLSLDDTKLPVWEQLMFALSSESRFSELLETCEDALDLFPNQAICYYYLGLAQMEQNVLDEARENLEETRFIASRNPRLKAMAEVVLAKVSIKESNFESAHEYLDLALENFPASHLEVLDIKGDIYFLQGNTEKALAFWQQARDAGNQSSKLEQKIIQKQYIK